MILFYRQVFQCGEVPQTGLFYPPTLITNVQTSSTIVLEEVFGPVAVALPFRTAKEAVALSNNTKVDIFRYLYNYQLCTYLKVKWL